MTDLHHIIITRSTFFANRVDTYARLKGLDNEGIVDHLQQLAQEHGEARHHRHHRPGSTGRAAQQQDAAIE